MQNKQTKVISFILCLFFGTLGVHRFYLGRAKSGFLMILTLGGVGLWYICDLILIAMNKLQKKEPCNGVPSSASKLI